MNNNCRICYENFDIEKNSELIYPCKCTIPVHKLCLFKWIKSRPKQQNYLINQKLTCEICKETYNILISEDIIKNFIYRYPSFQERQNILFYNRIYLFVFLNSCSLCFYITIFSMFGSIFYYIAK